MKASGQTISRYFSEHFAFLEELFIYSKNQNFSISNEVLINRCNAKNIDVRKLEKYKIIHVLPNGNYELNKYFTDFISFLINDFRLDLPDSIKKYEFSINTIYNKLSSDNLTLNTYKNNNQVIELINGLITEIKEFSIQIEANTNQLFVETTQLKSQKNKLNYSRKINKASDLIESYIQPLNNILNKEHTNSFIQQLARINDFANLQRHTVIDLNIRKQFDNLYQQISFINNNILKNASIMAKDVTPLIERLKNESEIMKGINYILLNAKKKKATIFLYFFDKKRNNKAYAIDFQQNAKNRINLTQKQKQIFIKENENKVAHWIFDEDKYWEKLLTELPISNFFEWCYSTLKEENNHEINIEKFYYVSSLLYNKKIQASFNNNNKISLHLKKHILTLPNIQVKLEENELPYIP